MKYKIADGASFKFTDAGAGGFAGHAAVFNNIDKQGERILKGAFNRHLDAFLRHGFIAWNHDADKPVGTIRSAREDSKGLYVEGIFHSDAHSQRVRTIVKERLER